MALVTKNFTLNVTPGAMPQTIHVSEYDVGRTYTITLLGENGSAFEIPTGTTAAVEGTLNGTYGFTTSATISGNQISFALTESMTAYAGNAWCKIKLTLNSEPIQTCAFILAVDRAGVEAETVIGAPGFEEQIVNAVNDWLDDHPPSGGGLTDDVKQALIDCFENVAWINDQGQTYYDALYAALYPTKTLVSISAAFTQGSAVISDTDSLDTLKQYLTVTAYYDDSSTGVVTNYTLSGTLTAGTSTITVLYNDKTTTFNVTVTHDTTAQIKDRGGYYNTGEIIAHDNAATTIPYQLSSDYNKADFCGVLPRIFDDITLYFPSLVYYENGTYKSYYNEYTASEPRWMQLATGTLTEFAINVTINFNFNSVAFSIDERCIDDSYIYRANSGEVLFAGRNTPYYGMSNISEAQS